MSEDDYDYLFKIVIIGDSSVGKSNLLSRFTVSFSLLFFNSLYFINKVYMKNRTMSLILSQKVLLVSVCYI